MNRRNFIQATSLGLIAPHSKSFAKEQLITRAIPSSGEALPIVGLGTWQSFDVANDTHKRNNLKELLTTFVNLGGKVIDSSPMYGSSESVVGDLAEELEIIPDLFLATKVWHDDKNSGLRQMEQSFQKMRTKQMDLMQVHNLINTEQHLETLYDWKESKKIRYIGITHYHSGGYQKMKQLMLAHEIDFIQINYSLLKREAEQELLPLAKEKGIAVLINRPFDAGNVFRKVKNKQLPTWVKDFDCDSWGQFFLKFILANNAVTCVIPGTSKLNHLKDNMSASLGRLPSQKQKQEMISYISSL